MGMKKKEINYQLLIRRICLALSGIDMLGYVFNGDNSSGGQGYGYGYRRYGNYGSYGSHYGSYGKYGAYGHYGKMEKGSTDKFGRVIKD